MSRNQRNQRNQIGFTMNVDTEADAISDGGDIEDIIYGNGEKSDQEERILLDANPIRDLNINISWKSPMPSGEIRDNALFYDAYGLSTYEQNALKAAIVNAVADFASGKKQA